MAKTELPSARDVHMNEKDVQFTSWANGGAALGRLADGRVVFADGVLPGEKALIRYADKESRFISAEVVKLIERSPMRIEPRCPLYGKCALCCMQNLEYPDQLHAKREILLDHLSRIGGVKDADSLTLPMIPSPAEWNYARSLILGLDADGNFCLPDKKGGAVRLEAYCPITAECINESLASFTFEPESGIREMEFRADDSDNIQLVLRGDSDKPEDEMENDTEISVVYQGPESSWVMAGVSTLQQQAAGQKICVADTGSFLKNPAIFDALWEKLQPLLPDIQKASIVDINCGTGFWSRIFGQCCNAVSALMPDERECEDFVYNLDDLENVSLYIGDIKDVLPGLPVSQNEWVLIEGGTTGLHERALTAICERNPRKILCLYEDPAILARDIKRLLNAGRTIETILPYDIAPQTASFGTLVIL